MNGFNEHDIFWGKLNIQSLDYAKAGNWGLYTNNEMDKADFLIKEKQLRNALEHYLLVLHLDLNEPNNYGNISAELKKEYPPFGPNIGIIAPSIVKKVKKIQKELNISLDDLEKNYFETITKRVKGFAKLLPISIDEAWAVLSKEINNTITK